MYQRPVLTVRGREQLSAMVSIPPSYTHHTYKKVCPHTARHRWVCVEFSRKAANPTTRRVNDPSVNSWALYAAATTAPSIRGHSGYLPPKGKSREG